MDQVKQAQLEEVKARLAKLGFNNVKTVGLNILPMLENQTRIVKINSEIAEFDKKDGMTTLSYIDVTDLETGEEGQIWSGGQLTKQLTKMEQGYIGGVFALTYTGTMYVEELKRDCHQYKIVAAN